LSIDGEVDEGRLCRYVEVPDVVVYGLVMPGNTAVCSVQGDHRARVVILVAVSVAAVVVRG
jgi:hypothetical protein